MAEKRSWDGRYRVERRGQSGKHDRYWIDCPFCGETIRTYGKNLANDGESTKCKCGALFSENGDASLGCDPMQEIRITLDETDFTQLIRGKVVEKDHHNGTVVKFVLADIGIGRISTIVYEAYRF